MSSGANATRLEKCSKATDSDIAGNFGAMQERTMVHSQKHGPCKSILAGERRGPREMTDASASSGSSGLGRVPCLRIEQIRLVKMW